MTVKKIRFCILEPELIRKKLKNIDISGIDFDVSAGRSGTVLKLNYTGKEVYSLFIDKMPDLLKFFLVDNLSDSIAAIASAQLLENKKKLVTVESCTGGLIGKMLTEMPGSSRLYWGGYITYDNTAKVMLGVESEIIKKHGAVSGETAQQMAIAGLDKSEADLCIAVTGIAGPEGGSTLKPAGTVWISLKSVNRDSCTTCKFLFSGSRAAVRSKAAGTSLLMVYRELLNKPGVDSNLFEDYI